MSTEQEWRRRVERWRDELPRHFYRPLAGIEMEGFTTFDQLTVGQAMEHGFSPMPVGTQWGAKWEYGWFHTRVALPEEAAGERIVLRVNVGEESAIYVNGRNAGARDFGRQEITLATYGEPGAEYDIMVEAYAGHGVRECCLGPTPLDRVTVPEPPEKQTSVGPTTFGIWEEDAYQLWIEARMLWEMAYKLDQNSLRVSEIQQALRDFTTIVDFELPHSEMLQTFQECRKRFRPLFECVNGSTAPTLYAFGHSHIDVAWLWPLRETEAKATRTFASQIALMDEYPEYKFLQSQAHLYWMMKNHYPALYAMVKQKVAAGQFVPDGGMWVEADTNISGGESLIRQFIHGKRFFCEEFGIDNQVLWLPDVFGYTGALPQIMRGCGVKYFSTAKIYWNYYGGDPFPYTTFTWEGIDGSSVLVSLCNDYNSHTNPDAVVERWNERRQKIGLHSRLMPFGWGDGGGGATRDHLEYLKRSADLEGLPKVEMATPIEFFHELEATGYPSARYAGELYYQCHRGVLTTQARTKKGNRKSEFALRESEIWAAAARSLAGFTVPMTELDLAWKQVLLNQFHDIIPGSSIHRVYEEAEAGYARTIATAQGVAAGAKSTLTDGSDALTVFNSLSWPRTDLVPLADGASAVENASGEPLPIQEVYGVPMAEVTVPSCGWTTVLASSSTACVSGGVSADDRHLENECIRAEFNDMGEIISLVDKTTGMELTSGPCNSFRMYKDVPSEFDAWDIDHQYMLTPVELTETAEIEVVAEGPLVAALKVTRRLHDSVMTQWVSLRRNSRRIDFETSVDWHERHKLLKVAFPVNIHSNEAIHDIQFGHIARPNHYSRQFDADRFEVANHKWTAMLEGNRGCAVLNDCKYGVNVLGSSINLTLLKSSLAPDMTADQGMQEFAYAFYAWNGSMAESDLVHEAYELNVPMTTTDGAAGERSLFAVDAPNVIIETVKPAEDGSNDIVVRLYESMRMATPCTLTTTLPITGAASVNMLEEDGAPLELKDGTVALTFRPFEIKTIRLSGE